MLAALLALASSGHVLIKSTSSPSTVTQASGYRARARLRPRSADRSLSSRASRPRRRPPRRSPRRAYGYFDMRVLSGEADLYFTKIELTIPRGIQSVEFESRPGWSFSYDEEPLSSEEQLSGHYGTLSTRPAKVTMEASTPEFAIKGSETMVQHFGARFGCFFDDADTNSIWRGHFTAWWGAIVDMSPADTLTPTSTTSYTACGRTGAEPWYPSNYPTEHACAYTYVSSSAECATNGDGGAGGMRFLDSTIEPAANQAEVTDESHVLELVDEFTGPLFDAMGGRMLALEKFKTSSESRLRSVESDVDQVEDEVKQTNQSGPPSLGAAGIEAKGTAETRLTMIAWVALTVSVLNLGAFLAVVAARFIYQALLHPFAPATTNVIAVKTVEQP
jgi:hypothetical protein